MTMDHTSVGCPFRNIANLRPLENFPNHAVRNIAINDRLCVCTVVVKRTFNGLGHFIQN